MNDAARLPLRRRPKGADSSSDEDEERAREEAEGRRLLEADVAADVRGGRRELFVAVAPLLCGDASSSDEDDEAKKAAVVLFTVGRAGFGDGFLAARAPEASVAPTLTPSPVAADPSGGGDGDEAGAASLSPLPSAASSTPVPARGTEGTSRRRRDLRSRADASSTAMATPPRAPTTRHMAWTCAAAAFEGAATGVVVISAGTAKSFVAMAYDGTETATRRLFFFFVLVAPLASPLVAFAGGAAVPMGSEVTSVASCGFSSISVPRRAKPSLGSGRYFRAGGIEEAGSGPRMAPSGPQTRRNESNDEPSLRVFSAEGDAPPPAVEATSAAPPPLPWRLAVMRALAAHAASHSDASLRGVGGTALAVSRGACCVCAAATAM